VGQFLFLGVCILLSLESTTIAFKQQDRLGAIIENIEKIESAAVTLDDPIHIVKVKVKAASLLWKIDRDIGRHRFVALLEWVNNSLSAPVILSKAKIEIFAQLYTLDSEQVNLLLRASSNTGNNVESATLSDKLKRPKDLSTQLGTDIAVRVVDSNPGVAASLIISEIKQGYSYPLHAAILRLAAKDQKLANQVVAQFLGVIDETAPEYSIVALHHLFGYFFRKSVTEDFVEYTHRDPALRDLYLRVSVKILEKSLEDVNRNRSSTDQRLVEMSQSTLAFQLKSVVGRLPTLEPETRKKVSLLSERLRSLVPQELEGQASTSNKDGAQKANPNQKSTHVIDPAAKAAYDNLIKRLEIQSGVREMISLKQFADAIFMIQAIEDRQLQCDLMNDLRIGLKSENEPYFSSYITELIISSFVDLPKSERKLEIMFQLISTENLSLNRQGARQFWSLFGTAIELLNELPATSELPCSDVFRNAIIKALQIDEQETLNRISDIKSGVSDLMAMLAVNELQLNTALAGGSHRIN